MEWKEKHKYLCKGKKPSASMNNKNEVVVVVEKDLKLSYSLGVVEFDEEKKSASMSWKRVGKEYDSGCFAGISMNDKGQVVEVHNSPSTNTLWYNCGTVVGLEEKGGRIEWKKNEKYDSGLRPRVCLHSSGFVMEIHKSENWQQIHYHVGFLNEDSSSISWKPSVSLHKGALPSISLSPNGTLLQVHQSSEGSKSVYYSLGSVDVPQDLESL